MDTTLRDGEQTPEVSYTPEEKLQLARVLLQEVRVDRIEIIGARVSEGERAAARAICRWAKRRGHLKRIEALGYCDGKLSADWWRATGGRQLNLLVKGSERHCRTQLRATPQAHQKRAAETIAYARSRRMQVSCYLEDWSGGMRESPEYVFAMLRALAALGPQRIYLADTLGIQAPNEARRSCEVITNAFPQLHFEYHCHNDYGLAAANCLAAVAAGCRGVHVSVNGLGERAGNAKLAEVAAALEDHSRFGTGVNLAALAGVSRLVESISGKEVAANAPIVGADVFTQTAGIHADGDAKGELYASRLAPKRFGRSRRYALGKLSGKASIDQNLAQLGMELSPQERDQVLQRVVELGDRKYTVMREDLRFIVADIRKTPKEQMLRVAHYEVRVGSAAAPVATVEIAYRGRRMRAEASGDGGYDAFMNAAKKALRPLKLEIPRLRNFRVRIPPGGRTSALVETLVTWAGEEGGEGWTTLGVDSDQLAAAVVATEKMLNEVASKKPRAARKK